MLPSRHWDELTSADLAAADGAGRMAELVAVLPLAATEQHGPHLPLGTDAFIAQGYLDRVLRRLPAELPAVLLPMQRIGCSLEHAGFPGTLSLPARVTLDAWTALLADVARAGCRRLVIVNAHGGNSAVIDLLALEARARHAMLAVHASWSRLGLPPDLDPALVTDDERAHGIHGGLVETALMLAFRPELVRMAALADFPSRARAIERENAVLRAFGRPSGFGWLASDLNPEGVVGDAAAATAAIGEAIAGHGADRFVALLREVSAFDVSGFAPL